MSVPKVKIAVLKNLMIFGEKYLPQSVRLLEVGRLKCYLAEYRLNIDFFYKGLPLLTCFFQMTNVKVSVMTALLQTVIIKVT